MGIWHVRVRNAAGAERVEVVAASTESSACTKAVVNARRVTGERWYAVTALPRD